MQQINTKAIRQRHTRKLNFPTLALPNRVHTLWVTNHATGSIVSGYHIPIFWDWNPEKNSQWERLSKALYRMEGVSAYQGLELVQSPDARKGFDREKENQKLHRHAEGTDKAGSGRNKHVTIKGKRQPLLNSWRSVSFLSNALHPTARSSPIFLLNYISKYFPRCKLELDRLQSSGTCYVS